MTSSRVCPTASHWYHLLASNSYIGCLGFWFGFFTLIFGAIQICILFRAAHALKILLTITAVSFAKTMGKDNRNQKLAGSLHRFFTLLILFLKFDFSFGSNSSLRNKPSNQLFEEGVLEFPASQEYITVFD